MHYSFRTPRRKLAQYLAISLSWLAVGVAAYFYLGPESGGMILVLSMLFAGIGIGPRFLPALSMRLDMDGWNVRSARLRVPWKDVLAVWIGPGQGGSAYLFLGTPSGVIPMPLGELDLPAVWAAVQACAHPQALEPDAPMRLPAVQQAMAAEEELRDRTLQPLSVNFSPFFLLAGAVGFAFFLGFSVAMLVALVQQAEDAQVVLTSLACFVPMTLACLWVAVGFGLRYEMDSAGIRLRTLWGRYYLAWEEVVRLRTNPAASDWVFETADRRRMVIAAPMHWSGPDRDAMLHLLKLKLEQHHIEVTRDRWLSFKIVWSRGCRVPPK